MSIVSVCRVETYEPEDMDLAVRRHFEAVGAEELFRPGTRVLIKPNLVAGRRPELAATTHPQLLAALCRALRDMGVEDIVIADSPGGPYTSMALNAVYSASGMKALAPLARLNEDTGFEQVFCPEGFENRWFNIISPVLRADAVINVAKIKTHGMTTMSAGIKNLFGCVPGLQKPELHYRHPENEGFARMLCELARLISPALTILDGVEGMEGNGPTGGTPRHLGLTLASRDLFAQDALAARLMGFGEDEVPMLRCARELGWYNPEGLELVGDEARPADPPFVRPDSSDVNFTGWLPAFLRAPAAKALGRVFRVTPRVDAAKCVGCGKCAESCPPHIIRMEEGKARFTARGCISCLCCQEMCPARAISVRRMIRL